MAQVLLKQGDLDTAEQVYYDVVCSNMKYLWVSRHWKYCLQLSISPNNEDAMHGIERIDPLRQSFEGSKILQARGDHHGAYSLLTDAIEVKIL